LKIDDSLLELIKGHAYVAHFKSENLDGLILWILDAQDRVADASPAMAAYYQLDRDEIIGKRATDLEPALAEQYLQENRHVRRLGQPSSSSDWIHLPVGWRKIAMTKCPLPDGYIIGVAHDITDTDPMAGWLQRLDLAKGRLNLGPRYRDEHLTLPEYLVLHRLSRNHSYHDIARELNISAETVKYRISRVKEKLNALNTPELWEEVYASGIIHLLALPLHLDAIPRTHEDLIEITRKARRRQL